MRILLLNQCFHPDVVSTAQHASDLAVKFVEAGHEVTVVASSRAYDQPSRRFPREEYWQGVRILRIPCSGFGKAAKWRRALDFATFLASCCFTLLRLPGFDSVVAMTSPPLISFLAALFVRLKGGSLALWIMDLNPDEAIAAGWLKPDSLTARLLTSALVYGLRRADSIVALDPYMKDRICAKGIAPRRVSVIPPWSHNDVVAYDPQGRDRFRREHNLAARFVVMYSGNHSPCHPLTSLLEAARRLRNDSTIAFCFIGGGSEFEKVKAYASAYRLGNIVCLPYQPRKTLAGSLSAADLHVVAMGEPFVGIVHPCKIYNILSLGTPVLYIGPAKSHVSDLLDRGAFRAWAHLVSHGEPAAIVREIRAAAAGGIEGQSSEAVEMSRQFSQEVLIPEMMRGLKLAAMRERAVAAVEFQTKASVSQGAQEHV